MAIAQAVVTWDQEMLAALGVRRDPGTSAHEPPSASTLSRVPAGLDADELDAELTG